MSQCFAFGSNRTQYNNKKTGRLNQIFHFERPESILVCIWMEWKKIETVLLHFVTIHPSNKWFNFPWISRNAPLQSNHRQFAWHKSTGYYCAKWFSACFHNYSFITILLYESEKSCWISRRLNFNQTSIHCVYCLINSTTFRARNYGDQVFQVGSSISSVQHMLTRQFTCH